MKKLLLALAIASATPALADDQPSGKYNCIPTKNMQEIIAQADLHLVFRGKSPTSNKFVGFLFAFDQPVIMVVEFDDVEACIIGVSKDSQVDKEQMKKLFQITVGSPS